MKNVVVLILFLSLPSCAFLRGVNWPKVVECTQEPGADLFRSVLTILEGDGDVESELKPLARKHGASLVLCVVQAIISKASASEEFTESKVQIRGQKFLDEVGTEFE